MPQLETVEPDVEPRLGYLDMDEPLDGFDWLDFRSKLDRIDSELAAKASFLVLFTSEQLEDLGDEDKELLRTLDDASHKEAKQSEALLKYFAGPVDGMRRALSWCLWTDRQAAADALHGPNHKQAIQLARSGKFYEKYDVRFYEVLADDETGFAFTPLQTGHKFDQG